MAANSGGSSLHRTRSSRSSCRALTICRWAIRRSTAVFKNLPRTRLSSNAPADSVYLLNGIELASGSDRKSKLPRWFFNSDAEKLIHSAGGLRRKSAADSRRIINSSPSARKHLTGLHDDAAAADHQANCASTVSESTRRFSPQLEAIDPAAFDSSRQSAAHLAGYAAGNPLEFVYSSGRLTLPRQAQR